MDRSRPGAYGSKVAPRLYDNGLQALIFIDNALGFACEERAPPVTPFADFVIEEAEIELGPQPDDDEFEVEGSFTLGSASDGIDPRSEDVTLEVGTFTTTIPVGSFELNNSGEFGEFEFEGVIGGVTLEFEIRINEDNSFEFEVEGEDAHLTGTVNPVKVTLTIGDYTGTTSVTAEIEEEDDDEDDDEDEDDDDKDDDDEDDDGEDDDDEDE